ncbi:MAG: hypothetical protein ACK559_00920, partial [bacterium]
PRLRQPHRVEHGAGAVVGRGHAEPGHPDGPDDLHARLRGRRRRREHQLHVLLVRERRVHRHRQHAERVRFVARPERLVHRHPDRRHHRGGHGHVEHRGHQQHGARGLLGHAQPEQPAHGRD